MPAIKPYPSIALGAFEATPLELAGAYTIFANNGIHEEPYAVTEVQASDGQVLKAYGPRAKAVIRPELAFLMTYLMEGVINSGTGAGVRSRGFTLPAAGKTGTSRDGWFAGYTKNLLAIAWAGYDDNRDINLEGARSALPIWTEFMLRAARLYPPRNVDEMSFNPPAGIEFSAACTGGFQEAFISGTVPRFSCGQIPSPCRQFNTVSESSPDCRDFSSERKNDAGRGYVTEREATQKAQKKHISRKGIGSRPGFLCASCALFLCNKAVSFSFFNQFFCKKATKSVLVRLVDLAGR